MSPQGSSARHGECWSQAVSSEVMFTVLPLRPKPPPLSWARILRDCLNYWAHYLKIGDMTMVLPWNTTEKIQLNGFFFFSSFFVNREINVNLIMMQSWRRGKRSANFIYKDIVPKERTAFICIISFIKNVNQNIVVF